MPNFSGRCVSSEVRGRNLAGERSEQEWNASSPNHQESGRRRAIRRCSRRSGGTGESGQSIPQRLIFRACAINHITDHEDGDTAGEEQHDGAGQFELGIGYVVGRKPWAQFLHVGDRASECLGGK